MTLGTSGNDCQVATRSTVCQPPTIIIVDSNAEAQNILGNSSTKDSSLGMTAQLLTAKLNIKGGFGNPSCILSTVQQADNALSTYGYGTSPTGAARQTELDLYTRLKYWNENGTCL